MTPNISPDEAVSNFPAPSFRPGQEEAVRDIASAIQDGKKYILLDAPTASGKSLINTAIARSVESAYYTTPYNQLIDQIRNDDLISDFYEHIQGRRHYDCALGADHDGVCPSVKSDNFRYGKRGPASNPYVYKDSIINEAIYDPKAERYREEVIDPMTGEKQDVTKEWLRENSCGYAKQAVEALDHERLLTNFWYFLLAPHFFPDAGLNKYPERDVLVIDEAHDLPTVLRENASINITQGWVNEMITDNDVGIIIDTEVDVPSPKMSEENVVEWVRTEFMPFLQEVYTKLDEKGERSDKEQQLLDRVDSQIKKAEEILDIADEGENIVVDLNEYKKSEGRYDSTKDGITIKPVDVEKTFAKLVASKADVILFSSATMFKFKVGELGVKDRDMETVRVSHNIPRKRRMAEYIPMGEMTRSKEEQSLPQVASAIEEIFNKHPDEKGIVHTVSFSRARRIQELLSDVANERIIAYDEPYHDGKEKKDAFLDHGGNAVFVTPSHTTGIDLKNDLARFNVVTKIPFPNCADGKVWSKRLDRGEWDNYYSTAFMELVQASGRTTRNTEDYSTTYILDESYGKLRNKVNRELVNHWFFQQVRERDYVEWVEEAPTGAKEQFEARR